MKVFKMDDLEWWAGESLEACVAEGRKQCGPECYPDDPSEQHEVSAEAMQRKIFVDEDGSQRTFAQELQRMVDAGTEFPCPFAATDW